MARESSIEVRGCIELHGAGYPTRKLGAQGWPDRIVFLPGRQHCFMEWKQPGGSLTPAQRRRIIALRERGELVAVLDDWRDAVAVASSAHEPWMTGVHPLFCVVDRKMAEMMYPPKRSSK